jgi:hypothetical protein
VKEIARVDDTKPGVLSRILLPIPQAHIYVAPFCLPAKVIYFNIFMKYQCTLLGNIFNLLLLVRLLN